MSEEKIILSETDKLAIDRKDAIYLVNKGAKLYQQQKYKQSVEYYRLAASLGEIHAISNLGYCYLYGRYIEANTDLAIAYFKIAAENKDVDAAYKLGDIYSQDKWRVKDIEKSIYYYSLAASILIGREYEGGRSIMYCTQLEDYPSLCFALGREMSKGGNMNTDIEMAYQFLLHAKEGYQKCIKNGDTMYVESYNAVLKLLSSEQFKDISLEDDLDGNE